MNRSSIGSNSNYSNHSNAIVQHNSSHNHEPDVEPDVGNTANSLNNDPEKCLSVNGGTGSGNSDVKSHSEPPYSIFNRQEIFIIGIFMSLTAYWSMLSSALYFPAIPKVSEEFNVSIEAANITVVVYLVFQSISPMILSGLSDAIGRKPVILLLLSCYIGVCVALSQVTVYWALLVLRIAQATSIASTISISQGMVADLTPKLTRGGFSGLVNGIVLSGQAFGGLVGGLLNSRWGLSGIFTFCAIGAGLALVCNLLFVPETNRTIVGNQSVTPPKIYHYLGLFFLPRYRNRLTNDSSTIIQKSSGNVALSAIKIFVTKTVFFALFPTGLAFATWTVSMTSLSTVLKNQYGYSDIQIGLCYIAAGTGSVASSITSGLLMNWNYKRRKAYCEQNQVPFVIHKVRLEFTTRLSVVFIASVLVFGWCLSYNINLAPILIVHVVLSASVIWFLTILQTVLVDLHPARSSAASSCLNLMRGGMSAIFVAAQDRMISSLTIGGCFTLLLGLYLASFIVFRAVIMTDKSPKSNKDKQSS